MSNSTTFSPHQLTANVKLLHKAAIISQNKVLILKRSPSAFSRPGKWDLPGGNSEWPTKVSQPTINLHQQDIVREIQEEVNLQLDPQLFTEDNLVYFATYFEPDRQVYSVNCGWKASIKQALASTVKLSQEHTDLAWISLSQLDQYDFGGRARDFETKIIRRVLS
jgi:8-oxo-dGTP pyrophosphatase MutT (NUDIX family)